MKTRSVLAAFAISAAAAGCGSEQKPPVADVRPVRTIVVEKRDLSEEVRLTGQIRPRDEAALAFRIGGRMIERPVNKGDRVQQGQTIAKLEPLDEMNALRSAQASLNSARGVLSRTRNDFQRQQTLLRQGHTTQARFDQSQQELQTAESQVKDAEAQLKIAQDRLGFTELKADAPGVITAVAAEPGEVVQAGRTIVQVARDGGRDAVFEVPGNILPDAPIGTELSVSLVGAPGTRSIARTREIAPQADPVTRNFQVRADIENPPDSMRLGSTVIGILRSNSGPVIAIPASALTSYDQKPAVWVVNPKNNEVAIRNVTVKRDEPSAVVISDGLDNGEIVVTAGVQALYPGRKVRLLGATS